MTYYFALLMTLACGVAMVGTGNLLWLVPVLLFALLAMVLER